MAGTSEPPVPPGADDGTSGRTPALDEAAARAADASQLKNAMSVKVAVTVGSKLLYMATRLVTPPVILAYVTLPEYGLWATCFTLISSVGRSSRGRSSASTRRRSSTSERSSR